MRGAEQDDFLLHRAVSFDTARIGKGSRHPNTEEPSSNALKQERGEAFNISLLQQVWDFDSAT
jgi:hypothetical protein